MKNFKVKALKDLELELDGEIVELSEDQSVDLIAGEAWPTSRINEFESLFEAIDSGNVVRELVEGELRIHKYLRPGQPVTGVDFSILSLRKKSPSYDRGRKLSALYMNDVDEVVVSKTFEDLRSEEDGSLMGIVIRFDWFKTDGSVGITKTEVAKEFNKYEAQTENRKRRERTIDYLIAGTKGTPIEQFMSMIFDHYADQIQKFKDKGTDDLASAILSEENPQINGILGIKLPRADGSFVTVQDSMLYQVSA